MTEAWKGWPGDSRYQVSDKGRVRHVRRSGVRKLHSSRGYLMFAYELDGIRFNKYVHRMVLETFVGPCPEGSEASHIDGDRSNNDVSNLIWESRLENMRRKKGHGTQCHGERHGISKLTEEDVLSIRRSNLSHSALGRKHGVSHQTVRRIRLREAWRHI